MQNIVISMREKFHDGRWTNDRALGDRKSDNNKNPNKNHIRGHWGPVSGSRHSVSVGGNIIQVVLTNQQLILISETILGVTDQAYCRLLTMNRP